VIVNVQLFVINIIQEVHYLWFYRVTIFWGIGLVMHASSVVGSPRFFGREWEEKKIKESMESDESKKNE